MTWLSMPMIARLESICSSVRNPFCRPLIEASMTRRSRFASASVANRLVRSMSSWSTAPGGHATLDRACLLCHHSRLDRQGLERRALATALSASVRTCEPHRSPHLRGADLENGVREIEERFGVRADGGGQHVGQGTHNKLLALGPAAYLEIIAPDPTQPEPPDPRPYGVDGITHSGLVGWAIACGNIDDSLEVARAAGYDPGEVIEGHRLTASG